MHTFCRFIFFLCLLTGERTLSSEQKSFKKHADLPFLVKENPQNVPTFAGITKRPFTEAEVEYFDRYGVIEVQNSDCEVLYLLARVISGKRHLGR